MISAFYTLGIKLVVCIQFILGGSPKECTKIKFALCHILATHAQYQSSLRLGSRTLQKLFHEVNLPIMSSPTPNIAGLLVIIPEQHCVTCRWTGEEVN